jgi:hypothetical protein
MANPNISPLPICRRLARSRQAERTKIICAVPDGTRHFKITHTQHSGQKKAYVLG